MATNETKTKKMDRSGRDLLEVMISELVRMVLPNEPHNMMFVLRYNEVDGVGQELVITNAPNVQELAAFQKAVLENTLMQMDEGLAKKKVASLN